MNSIEFPRKKPSQRSPSITFLLMQRHSKVSIYWSPGKSQRWDRSQRGKTWLWKLQKSCYNVVEVNNSIVKLTSRDWGSELESILQRSLLMLEIQVEEDTQSPSSTKLPPHRSALGRRANVRRCIRPDGRKNLKVNETNITWPGQHVFFASWFIFQVHCVLLVRIGCAARFGMAEFYSAFVGLLEGKQSSRGGKQTCRNWNARISWNKFVDRNTIHVFQQKQQTKNIHLETAFTFSSWASWV